MSLILPTGEPCTDHTGALYCPQANPILTTGDPYTDHWQLSSYSSTSNVADPGFKVNPDPTFHFDEDLDPCLHQSDANLRPLVYRPPGLHFEPPRLHCESSLLTIALDFGADPSYDFDVGAEPDPAFHSDADPV